MSLAWKATHESNAMPETVVKIIGSKHFRYLVEKPKSKQNENLKAETETALQKPMTGNSRQKSRDSLALTTSPNQQTNGNPQEVKESEHPGSIQELENNQKLLTGTHSSRFLEGMIPHQENVHCSSVPTGDQSLSYIHGLPRRKLRDWSMEQMVKCGSDQPEDIVQRPSGTRREDSFLLALVRRELKSHPLSSSLLDKLHKELKTLDPVSSGCLLHSQLSRLFLRHQVPLQLPTVKLLCQRFSNKDSSEMVNYGKIFKFLKGAASDDLQQSRTVVDSDLRTTQSPGNHKQSLSPAPPINTPPQKSSLQSEANRSLLEILRMVLRTINGKLNIENLSLSFRKEDRSFSGCLPLPKVRAICGKHGLYLTLNLLETLLHHQDLGCQDEIKWQNFVELLSRASSDLSDLPPGENEKEVLASPQEPGVSEQSQSKAKHMKTPEENVKPEPSPAEMPEPSPVETSAPKEPQNSLKIRPVSQPFVTPAMKNDSEECEMWIDRFRKLENALYLCDLSNTGVLEKERARRLIHNYNLIYNLSLSPQKIDQTLRRFRSGENLLLEPALRYLKEL